VASTQKSRPRGSRARLVLTLLGIVAFIAVIAWAAIRPAPSPSSTERRLPSFRLSLLSGGKLSSTDLRGHPVVLNLFASWCGPCNKEAARLEAAYARSRGSHVMFVGAATTDREEDVKRFVSRHGITYPIVLDPAADLFGELHAVGLPETFFIGPDGKFADDVRGARLGRKSGTVVLGPISSQRLTQGIQDLVQEKGS
jgi:peroxiredoxin